MLYIMFLIWYLLIDNSYVERLRKKTKNLWRKEKWSEKFMNW